MIYSKEPSMKDTCVIPSGLSVDTSLVSFFFSHRFFPSTFREPVQWEVPPTPADGVRPSGGALCGSDGVLHCSVHPQGLRA